MLFSDNTIADGDILTIDQLMTIKHLDPKDLAVGSIPVIGLLIVEAAFEGVEIEISAAVLDAGVL